MSSDRSLPPAAWAAARWRLVGAQWLLFGWLIASAITAQAEPLPNSPPERGEIDATIFEAQGSDRQAAEHNAKDAAPAEAERTATSDSREVVAIEATAEAYRAAVERGDLEAVAKFWTPNADYVDQEGHTFAIRERLAEAREKEKDGQAISRRTLAAESHSIRIVTPGVAIEDGDFDRSTGPARGHYTAVWLKRDGRWLLDGVRESVSSVASPADRLQGLGWMVGEWRATGDNVAADVSCVWGPDKNYLLRRIMLRPADGDAVSAIQWIGWDPVLKQVRSFVFDSRGGFGTGKWKKDGDAWIVSGQGVLADGRQTSGTNIYSNVDSDTAIWELVEDEVGGEPGADVRLDVKRKQKGAE